MEQTYQFSCDEIEVHVVLKRMKNMYMRVKQPDGIVQITAPYCMHKSDIEHFVRSRRDWIETKKAEIEYATTMTRKSDNQASFTLSPELWSTDTRRKAEKILRAKIEKLLGKWVPIIGKEPTHITYRIMKTRWGSCTQKTGRIRINLALAYVDDALLEYVFVHELTHLYEHGHGVNFIKRMDMYLPDWKKRRKELATLPIY